VAHFRRSLKKLLWAQDYVFARRRGTANAHLKTVQLGVRNGGILRKIVSGRHRRRSGDPSLRAAYALPDNNADQDRSTGPGRKKEAGRHVPAKSDKSRDAAKPDPKDKD